MESSDSIDKTWDTTSDLTATTALRSDPLASEDAPSSPSGGWMVNVAGRDIVEMAEADVIAKWRKREISASTYVWREGMDNWARLEAVPAFEMLTRPVDEEDEPSTTEDTNLVAVYERPMATLVFDEAVEDEWEAPKPREPARGDRSSEPSKGARSVSARPVAPSFPTLAPPKSLSVPADEPPPPPLPPRRSAAPQHPSRRPMPTIPGGLAPPAPRSTPSAQPKSPSPLPSAPPEGALRQSAAPARALPRSTAPTKSASLQPPAQPTKSPPAPATTSSAPSPLLAAIAAAASNPEPVVEPATAPAAASPTESSAPVNDEASFVALLQGTKTVSLRNAAIACLASALLASLMTGLVVGSRSPEAARPAEATKAVAAMAPTTLAQPVVPAPIPTPALPPPASESTTAPPTAPTAENVQPTELATAEKPKPKTTKISTWKPPRPLAASSDGPAEVERSASPERDDPERAVPDRPVESSSAPPAADPGF